MKAMKNRVHGWRERRDEEGLTTAEYAVGTVGACGVAGILVELSRTEWFADAVRNVFERALSFVPSITPFF